MKTSEKTALPIKSVEKLSRGLQFNRTVGTVLQYFSCLWQWVENKMYLWTKQLASHSQNHNYSCVKSLTYTKAKRDFAEPHVKSSLWVTSDFHSEVNVQGTRVCKSRCWLWPPFCVDQALSIKLVKKEWKSTDKIKIRAWNAPLLPAEGLPESTVNLVTVQCLLLSAHD